MPSSPERSLLERLGTAVIAVLGKLRRSTQGHTLRTQRIVAGISALVFVVAIVLAIRALPDIDRDIRWLPLVLVAIPGGPILMALNAAEYGVSAWILGIRLAPVQVLRVAVAARAANLLPIPGSILIRSQALKVEGSSYKHAFGVTTAIGILWFAAGALLTGAWQVAPRPALGFSMLAAGVLALLLGHWMLGTMGKQASAVRKTALVLAVELGMILVKAARYYLVMIGLDLGGDFGAAVAITLAGIIASAVGFFPGGLGLRELLAAAIGPIVALPAASALLATGVDLLIQLPILAIAALALTVMPGTETKPEAETKPEPET